MSKPKKTRTYIYAAAGESGVWGSGHVHVRGVLIS